jgi:hypothetical protein
VGESLAFYCFVKMGLLGCVRAKNLCAGNECEWTRGWGETGGEEQGGHQIDAVSISDTHTIASCLIMSLSDIMWPRISSLQFKVVSIALPVQRACGMEEEGGEEVTCHCCGVS